MTDTIDNNPYRHDLRQLSLVANHVLAQRVAAYPDAVAAGRMTPADADRGIKTLTAIASLFHAAARVEPIPPRNASRAAMHAEMQNIAARATERADRAKAELYERGQSVRGIALCCQMMAHYLRPYNGQAAADISMIEHSITLTLEIRALRDPTEERKAA
jgi:hypothetical protein